MIEEYKFGSIIIDGKTYTEDVERARAFTFLLKRGYVGDLAEAGIRFVISNPSVSTALVGERPRAEGMAHADRDIERVEGPV